MTQRLSPHKVTKMMSLYYDGYSQPEIARILKVNQSTVSIHVKTFESLADQQGLEAAGRRFDIVDKVDALHSLAAELRRAKLTVEEAAIGLSMERTFQKYGVKHEDYGDLIQACTKMSAEGFIVAAVRLNRLETKTGMSYEQIVAHAVSTSEQLSKARQDLQISAGRLSATNRELTSIDDQRKLANQRLEAQIKQVGVDMNRLKSVEALALILREAGVSNRELEDHIRHQRLLSKAGMSAQAFAAVLDKVRVLTAHDGGQDLLRMLSRYESLAAAVKMLQDRQQTLGKQVADLERTAELKNQMQKGMTKLKAEKASLEKGIAHLSHVKETLIQLQKDVNSLTTEKTEMEHAALQLSQNLESLERDFESRQKEVSDLEELQARHRSVSVSLRKIEAEIDSHKTQLEVLHSFLGFIQPSSLDQIESFANWLPRLLADVRQKNYSPEFLRNHILKTLSGGTLNSLICASCKAEFVVDKPSKYSSGYYCPVCMSSLVEVNMDEVSTLKRALHPPQPTHFVPRRVGVPLFADAIGGDKTPADGH